MPCVRPFGVHVTAPRATSGLVLACDAYTAAHRHMHSITRVLRKAERNELIDAGACVTAELFPYRIGDHGAFWARDLEHAFTIARPVAGEHALPVRADHYDVLVALSDADLIRQSAYVWTSASAGSDMHRMVPNVFQRFRWRAYIGGNMSRLNRLQVAMALRLAIELPWVPSPTPKYYSIDGAPGNRDTSARRVRHETHDGNVGADVVDAMISVVGPDMQPYDETARHVIARFCRAYGYEPETLRWTEIAALWCGGEIELEKRRLDDNLGVYDYFRYGGPKVRPDVRALRRGGHEKGGDRPNRRPARGDR